jgi:selenocysteine-specific elongation factor
VNDTLTLGVVGHVDHGKTALVRALTGIETDRLKEERERGLSIVLGFAYLETEHGVVDLIDVPGHENFIRAMIGGATGLDGIVLCVAANEGVMPQTAEHFNIARLLEVDRGFVVVTKVDLVDAATLTRVGQEIKEFVRGTFLEGAPVIEASAQSGAGIDDVRRAVVSVAAAPVDRDAQGQFFLPLDRVFTMRGFGLVVTGTLRRGYLRVGDAVEILPSGRTAIVRALQNHNRPVQEAAPGQRIAVNLRHADRKHVKRGDVLAPPGSVTPTTRIDARLRLVDDARGAIHNGAVVRIMTGTTEAMAKLRLLDRRALEPRETSMAQLDLDREIATLPAEHFLLRSHSPMHTIGGGRVLRINAERHRRFDALVTEHLATIASGDTELLLEQRLGEAGGQGVRLDALTEELGIERDALENALTRPGCVSLSDDLVIATEAYDALLSEIVLQLQSYHEEHPLENGLDVGRLTSRLQTKAGPDVLRHAVRRLVGEKKISDTQRVLSIAGFDPFTGLSERERAFAREIEEAFLAGGLEPQPPQAVVGSDAGRRAVYRLLLETGRLVRLKTYDRNSQIVLHERVLEDAKEAIHSEYPYPAAFALKDIRDLLGSTRKHVVPLMEHLDATGMTVRSGDLRRLREQGQP